MSSTSRRVCVEGWSEPRRFGRSEPGRDKGEHASRHRDQYRNVAEYDAIARIYDPWSASVIEDISFYVDEALASGGPVVELGVGTGRIAIPVAAAGIDVIGVDAS